MHIKKTKIVATISNLNCEPGFIKQLFDAGMNAVRLNTAHMTIENAIDVIKNIRAVSDKLAIILDTKGPEIRTTKVTKEFQVKKGDLIDLTGDPDTETAPECINVSYKGIANDVIPGKFILIDDGELELKVIENTGSKLVCEVQNNSVIKSRKSINIPGVEIKLPALTEKDVQFIKFAAEYNLDFIAHSFVRKKEDVIAVQTILDIENSPLKIISKIENQEGLENIDEILDHSFGIMVARGDLAIEVPAERIPLIQKALVKKCVERRKPVIIATQMLHSMITSPRPTRAEVSDVGNACLDGTDAVMLSGETASGKYPVEAVKTMHKIACEIEASQSTYNNTPYTLENKVTDYLTKSAVKAALRLNTKAIIADTLTGRTIRGIAAYRGENPIYAQCYNKRVMRELAISFGAHCHYMERHQISSEFIRRALTRLIEEKCFGPKDLIVILAGHFGSANGASYVEISAAENLLQRQ